MSGEKLNRFELKMLELTERKGFKIALFSIAATTILGNAVITSALPSMNAYFAAKLSDKSSFTYEHLDILVRLVLTIPAIFVMLLSPLAGYLMDSFGKLRFLLPAIGLWTIAGMAGFFLDDIYSIIFSRALLGVAMAFLMIGASALLADYYSCGGESRREQALSWQGFFCAVGGSLFIFTGGFLSMRSWRDPFLIYAFGFVILLMAIIYLFEPKHKINQEGLVKVKYKNFLPIYFAGFTTMVVFYIIPTQLPYFMQDELGYLPKYIGISIALMAFLEGIFSLSYKRLAAFVGIKGVYVLCFFLMGAGLALLHFFSSLLMINIALAFIGIALAYVLINNAEYLFKICEPGARARVFGMLASCVFFSQFISPLLTQPLVNMLGFRGLFLFCACLLFLLGFLYLIFFRQRHLNQAK